MWRVPLAVAASFVLSCASATRRTIFHDPFVAVDPAFLSAAEVDALKQAAHATGDWVDMGHMNNLFLTIARKKSDAVQFFEEKVSNWTGIALHEKEVDTQFQWCARAHSPVRGAISTSAAPGPIAAGTRSRKDEMAAPSCTLACLRRPTIAACCAADIDRGAPPQIRGPSSACCAVVRHGLRSQWGAVSPSNCAWVRTQPRPALPHSRCVDGACGSERAAAVAWAKPGDKRGGHTPRWCRYLGGTSDGSGKTVFPCLLPGVEPSAPEAKKRRRMCKRSFEASFAPRNITAAPWSQCISLCILT